MSEVASLESYRRRRFPPRDFQIDPVMTVYVALDGLLKALERLQTAKDTRPTALRATIATERARIVQGIDFVFGGIDLQAGSLASGLLVVLMHDIRARLIGGLDRGEAEFPTEAETLRRLHALFAHQAQAAGRAHG